MYGCVFSSFSLPHLCRCRGFSGRSRRIRSPHVYSSSGDVVEHAYCYKAIGIGVGKHLADDDRTLVRDGRYPLAVLALLAEIPEPEATHAARACFTATARGHTPAAIRMEE